MADAGPGRTQLTLVTDRTAYRSGEPIELRLRLVNQSSGAVTLEFSSAQRFDFVIEDAAGVTVWQWSGDQMFAQLVGGELVPRGGALEYSERLRERLRPGTYRVTGRIASNPAIEAGTTITIS